MLTTLALLGLYVLAALPPPSVLGFAVASASWGIHTVREGERESERERGRECVRERERARESDGERDMQTESASERLPPPSVLGFAVASASWGIHTVRESTRELEPAAEGERERGRA